MKRTAENIIKANQRALEELRERWREHQRKSKDAFEEFKKKKPL